MKTVVWIGRYMKGGFAPGTRRNVKAITPFLEKIIIAPLYVLPPNHELSSFVEDFDEEEGNFFKVVNHLPVTDPTADAYYSVIEYNDIPGDWIKILQNAKVIMTESTFCKKIFSQHIKDISKIHVIPYILSEEFINFQPDGPRLRTIEEKFFVFGSVFDWVPRKVPQRMILAFLKEFSEDEPVKLLMRTNYPEDISDLKNKLGNYFKQYEEALKNKRIIILKDRIDNIIDFYRGIDAYISATAGEGYGQTLVEAMACGLPTIGSNHSGNLDFMNESNSYLVEVKDWSPAEGEEKWNLKWKLPIISSIMEKMRIVYEDFKNTPHDPNIEWAIKIRNTLTPKNVGQLLFKALENYI